MTQNLQQMSTSDSNVPGKDVIDSRYVLPRNETEGQRLDTQHDFLTDVLGGQLVLDQSVKLGQGDRVLDAGTGAGIIVSETRTVNNAQEEHLASWIIALSKQVPKDVTLIGTDISSAMFPEQLPDNVHLFKISSTDLPREWTGTFSLVSQRLLGGAFTVPLWKTVLSELFRILKPEGVIQFMEFGHIGSTIDLDSIPAFREAMKMVTTVANKRDVLGFKSGIMLPGMLEEAGFCDIRCEVYKAPLGEKWGKIGVKGEKAIEGALRAFGRLIIAEGGLGMYDSQVEVDAMIDQTKKEWNRNSGLFIDYFTITARKNP